MPGVTMPVMIPPFEVKETDSMMAWDASYPCAMPTSAPTEYVITKSTNTVIASFTASEERTRRPI